MQDRLETAACLMANGKWTFEELAKIYRVNIDKLKSLYTEMYL